MRCYSQTAIIRRPSKQGLPKSFLNRFTRVHVEPMEATDLVHITAALYPRIPPPTVARMVAFTGLLAEAAGTPGGTFARAGAVYSFSLLFNPKLYTLYPMPIPYTPCLYPVP